MNSYKNNKVGLCGQKFNLHVSVNQKTKVILDKVLTDNVNPIPEP